MTNNDIKVWQGCDGSYIAVLKEYPPEYEKHPYRTYAFTGAKNENEAIEGIKKIYPELFLTSE